MDSGINRVEEIELDYESNNIAFDIAALEFTVPSKNQFEYRLDPIEQSFQQSNNGEFIRYVDLAADDYTFYFRASNNDGVWSDETKTISINIKPPFYEETWFILMAILLVSGLTALGLFLKFRAQRRRGRGT